MPGKRASVKNEKQYEALKETSVPRDHAALDSCATLDRAPQATSPPVLLSRLIGPPCPPFRVGRTAARPHGEAPGGRSPETLIAPARP
jgi:hypothetical protein